VEGAPIPVSNRLIPPWRNRSMPSILSAPAAIPRPVPGPSGARSPRPDPSGQRGRHQVSQPARCASDKVRASPAHDTRFGSSKAAEMAGNHEKLASSGCRSVRTNPTLDSRILPAQRGTHPSRCATETNFTGGSRMRSDLARRLVYLFLMPSALLAQRGRQDRKLERGVATGSAREWGQDRRPCGLPSGAWRISSKPLRSSW